MPQTLYLQETVRRYKATTFLTYAVYQDASNEYWSKSFLPGPTNWDVDLQVLYYYLNRNNEADLIKIESFVASPDGITVEYTVERTEPFQYKPKKPWYRKIFGG